MSNYKPVTEEVLQELRAAVGAEYVYNDVEKLNQYKTDEETDVRFHHLPEVVVAPANTEEVAKVVRIANKIWCR
jgi:glycolate oxidase